MNKQKFNKTRERMINVNYSLSRINDPKYKKLINNLLYLFKEKYSDIELLIKHINSVNVEFFKRNRDNIYVKYINNNFSDYSNVLTKREKAFLLNYINSINIDLTTEQRFWLIDELGKEIITYLHNYYDKVVGKQSNEYELKVWDSLSKDLNFLDFISTMYKENGTCYFAYSQYELINFMEAFGYAKDRIPKLKPYYYKIFDLFIKYFGKQNLYPFNDFYCKKEFVLEYIMNERTLTKEEKKLFMDKKYVNKFYLAILASKNFTKEEKLRIIDNMNYSEALNNMFFKNVFCLENYLYDDILSIDIEKLYHSSSVEIIQILENIVDENKLPRQIRRFYGTISSDNYHECVLFNVSENEMSNEEIKEEYINNFVEMCKFLKKMYGLKKYQLRNFVPEENYYNKEELLLDSSNSEISLSRIRKKFNNNK